MRCIGTVVRGIRTPIIKENDDLATIVVDSIMAAKESEGFEFKDKDVVAITEAVVGILFFIKKEVQAYIIDLDFIVYFCS